MKRFFSIIVALILVLSVATVSANVPEALKKVYTNYSCDYTLSMSFENCDELVSLLEEIEMPDEINNYIDVEALIDSIFTQDVKMEVKADIAENFRRMDVGLLAYSEQALNVNSNLSMNINSKFGMWIKLDLDAQEPVFKLIYSAPVLNRYMVIDYFEIAGEDFNREKLMELLNSLFNEEYMKSVMEYSVELIEKYADIKTSGSRCTMKIDNNGFVDMMNDAVKYAYDLSYEKLEPLMDEEADVTISMSPFEEIFPDNIQILGKDGITAKYTLKANGISTAEVSADVAISVKDIYEASTGNIWEYESDGVLKFSVKEAGKITDVGKTKVDFPVITEENSFDATEFFAVPDPYVEYEEDVPSYPYSYVNGYADYLPIKDGVIYVPLRSVMEGAYGDTVNITYNNGVITLESEYFDKIALTIGSDKVYTKGSYVSTDKVLKIDNVTYVGTDFFEEFFGLYLASANHNLKDDTYSYLFINQNH